jgi:glutathione S-transferase
MAPKPIVLYTAGTPNGQKVHNFVEELKEAYGAKTGFSCEYKSIDMAANEQKEEWFLKVNPNGRIPAIVDPNFTPAFNVFETAAIILWLEKEYDPDHLFSWSSSEEYGERYRNEALQWIFFVHGGIGPMQGQLNHFGHYAPEDIPYAKTRYLNETKRLYSVVESRLQDGREWLVGPGKGKYSIADINAFPWMALGQYSGLAHSDIGPNTLAWLERNHARPAVKAGMNLPKPNG